MADGNREWWTAQEFFAHFGVNEATGYAALKRGEIAGSMQIGRCWRIVKSAFYASLATKEQQTGKG